MSEHLHKDRVKLEAQIAWARLMAEWSANRQRPSNWPPEGQVAYLQAALAEMRAINARLVRPHSKVLA